MNSVILSALEIFPRQLEQMFAMIPAEHLHWKPESWDGVPSEMLNPIEQICHVRDIEVLGYQVRFKRMLEEDNPLLASIESYGLVESGDYAKQDPAAVFAEIRKARSQTVELLRTVGDAQLCRKGSFEGYGPVTLKSLIYYLCSHDQQHLAGLQWLLGKIDSAALPQ
ncbi:MAG TPA: DinB family protein [Burkholderiaceae bacterium]